MGLSVGTFTQQIGLAGDKSNLGAATVDLQAAAATAIYVHYLSAFVATDVKFSSNTHLNALPTRDELL
jgi:hypothetical protein